MFPIPCTIFHLQDLSANDVVYIILTGSALSKQMTAMHQTHILSTYMNLQCLREHSGRAFARLDTLV